MTAPKPPDQKTLVGLPGELKAILERPRTLPPPLPAQRAHASQPAAAPSKSDVPMDRTLIGIPSEMQAALERALAEQASKPARARPQPVASAQVEVPPTASGSVLRVQAVRTVGVSPGSPQADPQQRPRVTPARRPPPQQLPPRPNARRSAPSQQPPKQASEPQLQPRKSKPSAQRTAPHRPSVAPPQASKKRTPSQPQLTSRSELLAQSQITDAPFLAPNAPLDWPPAQRRSDSGSLPQLALDAEAEATAAPQHPEARRATSQPMAAEPSVIVEAHEPYPEPEVPLLLRTRLSLPPEPALVGETLRRVARKQGAFTLPPGSGHAKTKRTKAVRSNAVAKTLDTNSPKRWPAIALIGLAVVAFACVIVLRAPNVLPAPLAALLAPDAKHGQGDAADAKAAGAPPTAAAPLKPMVSDVSAATNPSLAPPSPTRPPASPPFTSGVSALLEKKAIDRLVAEDYPAALQAYERLRSAEPNRPEFGVMVELITRTSRAGAAP